MDIARGPAAGIFPYKKPLRDHPPVGEIFPGKPYSIDRKFQGEFWKGG
jgi:hypothetical protein